MPKRKRRIVPRQPNVGSILPVVQRMIAIDALLAGDGLIIDLAAEELGVVGRSVRRSLDILRELAGPTVFEIDEASLSRFALVIFVDTLVLLGRHSRFQIAS